MALIAPISSSIVPMDSLRLNLLQPQQRTAGVRGVDGAAGAGEEGVGNAFGAAIGNAVDHLVRVQNTADAYARQAATGNLQSVQDYMIAATESQLTTQLTIAVRNRAVEAFQEIMRMQV